MERTAANLANHLQSRDHAVSVLYVHRDGSIPIYNVDAKVKHFTFQSTDEISDIVKSAEPDVIVAFYSHAREANDVFALIETEIPTVLHEGSNPERIINRNWADAKGITQEQAALERLAMMANCARLRFTLPDYRRSIPEELLPYSVSFPNAFANASAYDLSLRKHDGRKIFLNIGGLKKVKNVMAAVRAFALVADELPEWDFHIFSDIPKDDSVRSELKSFVSHKKLENRVKIYGPTSFIGREYGRSHLHVIASKEEGLPNCVAEASRHGLPSIGFACCAGTNSMIVDNHNGLLVECGRDEITALASALHRAASDDEARERWGATALRESSVYDPDCIFAQWERLLVAASADRATLEDRLRCRFGKENKWRQLRAVQRASFRAIPWPVCRSAPSSHPSKEALPQVSIVVPLFNKEAHIRQTLETVAACSYPITLKEVIVVDDKSTDSSATIAGQICESNGWHLVRHELNKGLSVARNTGLDLAKGEYIHFWDADDLYATDGLRNVVHAMQAAGADIGTGLATRDGRVLPQYAASEKDVSGMTYAQMPDSLATASACFKIYRRNFLKDYGLRFEPDLYMQDSAFNLCAFPLAERIVVSSSILGEYQKLDGSASRQFHIDRFTSALKIDDLTRKFYMDNGLHALDEWRQKHVMEIVFPQFVRRARNDLRPIDKETCPEDMNFIFLDEIQARINRLSKNTLVSCVTSNRVHLAYYAIREGYLVWIPELLTNVLPQGWRANLLAKNRAEKKAIDILTSGLNTAKTSHKK